MRANRGHPLVYPALLFPPPNDVTKVLERSFCLSDSALFISGSLFTTDYLAEAIKADPAYSVVDVAVLRIALERIAAAFPQSHKTNESQTEDDFIWPGSLAHSAPTGQHRNLADQSGPSSPCRHPILRHIGVWDRIRPTSAQSEQTRS